MQLIFYTLLTDRMLNYSIIIPHKNIPGLLQRCLDSIPQREDTQVIIVDDNSDSSVVDFNAFPGLNRDDVECIFTKEGKGAGYARNVGLDNAKGKWIIFADADDYFTYCFNEAMDTYCNSSADVIFFNASSADSYTYVNSNRAKHINRAHLLPSLGEQKGFFFRYEYGEPWGKFIKKILLDAHTIRCEEVPIHNDTQLSYLVGYYAKEIEIVNKAIYCVTSRPCSVSKQISDECYFTRLSVFCKKYQFLKSNGISLFEHFILETFEHYRMNKDTEHLKLCYDLVEKYGITSSEIDKRLFKRQQRRFKSKLLSRMKLIFGHPYY